MKNNSILESLKKIYTKMTGKKVVKRKTETDVLSDIAEAYDPSQSGGGSTVSGTDDGTNWTSLTIGDKTRAIPQGGSDDKPYYLNIDMILYLTGKHIDVDNFIDVIDSIDSTILDTSVGSLISIPYSNIEDIKDDGRSGYSNIVQFEMTDGSGFNIDFFGNQIASLTEENTVRETLIANKNEIESHTFSNDSGIFSMSSYELSVPVVYYGYEDAMALITFDQLKSMFSE